MYHSGGQAQKDAVTIICMSQQCSQKEAHAFFKNRPTRQQQMQQMREMQKGIRPQRPRR